MAKYKVFIFLLFIKYPNYRIKNRTLGNPWSLLNSGLVYSPMDWVIGPSNDQCHAGSITLTVFFFYFDTRTHWNQTNLAWPCFPTSASSHWRNTEDLTFSAMAPIPHVDAKQKMCGCTAHIRSVAGQILQHTDTNM